MTPVAVLIAVAAIALAAIAIGALVRRRASPDAGAARRSHTFSAVAMLLTAAFAVANAVIDADSRVFLLVLAAIMAVTGLVVLRQVARGRSGRRG
ncbi:hypothetical protein [Mycobacterium sp. NPDC050041]|uniref:hypothetical protein n=1 Tax=Mycobacterium sp. NPDC050041 TaxID=3364293 RepID=UPI003C2C2D30